MCYNDTCTCLAVGIMKVEWLTIRTGNGWGGGGSRGEFEGKTLHTEIRIHGFRFDWIFLGEMRFYTMILLSESSTDWMKFWCK